jgi:hypothetical protein
MKALLSVNITESQKGEFPTWDRSVGVISVCPDFPDFTTISLSSAVRRNHQAETRLFSGALLAVSCDYQ